LLKLILGSLLLIVVVLCCGVEDVCAVGKFLGCDGGNYPASALNVHGRDVLAADGAHTTRYRG